MSKIYDELCNAHIPANHRGDDPATIGSFPCECSEDLADMELKKLWEDIDQLGKDTEALKRLVEQLEHIRKRGE